MALSKAELVEFIFEMVEKAQGKKQLKAMDIQKAVLKAHPDQDKTTIKFGDQGSDRRRPLRLYLLRRELHRNPPRRRGCQALMNKPCPRLLLSALRGGAGKTTLTLGLLAAWRDQGRRVVPFKKGPDYIDPAWHCLAAGCPSHNLDPFLMEGDQILASVARHALRRTPS